MARNTEEKKKKKKTTTKQDNDNNASPNFNYLQNSSFLRKGSKVEVCSEEDGYQNAWFPATVVDPPTPTKKPSPKTALVRYDHMLCEATGDLLVERVKASLIRPAPPEDRLEPFHRYDVVDAFYNDTWWIGYVVRVVNDRYVVAFKNPPDVLELGRSDLRAHWDWLHASNQWVRPPKEVTTGSLFSPAMEIELDLNKDKPGTTWLPAIYLGELGHGFHMVKYKSSNGKDGEGFETLKVHLNQVRPRPPKIEDKDFELLEKVDALHGSFWTVGVITKFLLGNRYTVTFKHEKKEVGFDYSELRPHMDWTGERWVSNSKVVRQEFVRACNKDKSVEIVNLDGTTCSLSESSSSLTPIHTEKRTLHLSRNSVDQAESSPVIPEESPYFESSNKEKANGASNNEKTAEELPIRVSETATEKEGQEMDNNATISTERRETPQKSQFGTISWSGKLTEDSLIEVADKETSEPGHAREESQTSGVVEEEPKEMTVSQVENCCLEKSDNIGTICEIITECELPIESLKPAVEVDIATGEAVLATEDYMAEKLEEPAVPHLKLTDPQPWVPSGYTQASVDDQAFSSHAEETNSLTTANKSPGGTESTNDTALPFVKRSPIWQFIESMEVFRKLPQRPHFRPLLKCKKEEREGLAIGHMVNYANLIGKILELQENVSQEYVDVIIGALAGYEEMGFEVEAVRDRLNEWLKTKAELERLENKLQGIERSIEERANEKARIDNEVNEVDDEIKKLTGKRSLLVEESAERYSKIVKLSSEAATIDTEICSTREIIRHLVLVI